MKIAKMGIVRETMKPQVMEDNDEKIHFNELIDLTLVAISGHAREIGLNILNNAKKDMIDNFFSIKWFFHKIEELKENRIQEEG